MKSELSHAGRVGRELIRSFGENDETIIVRSPGRINLIGEHTDYNEGFVLPSAIDRAIYLALAPGRNHETRIKSLNFDEVISFDVSRPVRMNRSWANYLVGIVDQLAKAGKQLSGFDCVFTGDIPIGAGMSSSAAIEAGLAFALNTLFDLKIDLVKLARLAQRAENEFVGVRCGIMDQFANLMSKGDSAIQLDCRSLEYRYIPFSRDNLKFVLCDTGVKHDLASSEYNVRRLQCESGVEKIRSHVPAVHSLRDVNIAMLEEFKSEMDETVYKRCSFVLEENARLQAACTFLQNGDFVRFGEQLYKSHEGLRDKYEVTCRELDILVEAASEISGVLGARMMGGGFGGCTLNLVVESSVREFESRISEEYLKDTGINLRMFECNLVPGTSIVHD